MNSALAKDLKTLIALVDETNTALKNVPLDHLAPHPLRHSRAQEDLAQLQMELGKIKYIEEISTIVSEEPDVTYLYRRLARVLREAERVKKRYHLTCCVPKLWPWWQFWKRLR